MITLDSFYKEKLVGLSTDEKPVININNGDMFFEMDTNKNYIFDKQNSTWREISANEGSSSGGSGGEGFLVIEIDWDDDIQDTSIINCSVEDILTACRNRLPIFIYDIEEFGKDNAPMSVSNALWQTYGTTSEQIELVCGRFKVQHNYSTYLYAISSNGSVIRTVYNS